MSGARRSWPLALAVLVSGCPFSPSEINNAPFYCASSTDCAKGQACGIPGDGGYRLCVATDAFCANESFDPGMGETDVDCGGPCAPCRDSFICAVDADCASGACAALWDTRRCVLPPAARQSGGKYVAATCNCPVGDGPPCGTADCLAIESCDGLYCRYPCIADADCPLHEGSSSFCANQACVPGGVPCPATTAFLCSIGGEGQAPVWGFAICEGGTSVSCKPIPVAQ